MKMIANSITVSRMLISFLLLFLPLSSPLFALFYLLCGISDVLDGFAARKLHTESEKGAALDSAADLLFAVIYAVRVLPLLPIPPWIWGWTGLIAAVKVYGIILASKKKRRFFIRHSFANKLTGLSLFFLPLTVRMIDVEYSAAFVCAAATFAAGEEIVDLQSCQK